MLTDENQIPKLDPGAIDVPHLRGFQQHYSFTTHPNPEELNHLIRHPSPNQIAHVEELVLKKHDVNKSV